MTLRFVLPFLLLLFVPLVVAQPGLGSYEDAARSAEADLKTVLAELARLRQQIAAERPPLAKETAALASELRVKRVRVGLDAQGHEARQSESAELATGVQILKDEGAYIDTLLDELGNTLRVNMHPAEAELEAPRFLAADNRSANNTTNKHHTAALVDFAIARLAAITTKPGPRLHAGQVLDPKGRAVAGTFIEAGPVQWFLGEDAARSGLVKENHKLEAELVPGSQSPETFRALAALRDGKAVSPAFDPTLGGAEALESTTGGGLLAHVKKGGLWIIPILLLAAVALIAALLKWLQLAAIRRVRPAVVSSVLSHLRAGEFDQAKALVGKIKHPARAVLARGLELSTQAGPAPSRDAVEEVLYEEYLAAQPRLGRWLPFIRIAAATAPLLGLLGTVTGMIHTFDLINLYGTGDAKTLAGGISEALVTTEFGLIVAIPALLLHAWLSRRVQAVRSEMEMTSLAFLNGLDALPATQTETPS